MPLRASIVVPTYRRPELLRRCLAALVAQALSPPEFEIIIVDDSAQGPDASREVTSVVTECQSSATPPIRALSAPGVQGPAAARNRGWRATMAPIVAFTDDDCVPDPYWLVRGLAAVEAGADAATGKVVVPLPERPTDYERDAAGLESAEFVTANCFCRRAALETIGGFDERFAAAWREDSDLHFSLVEHGYRIAKVPGAIVVHPVRPAPWGISLRQQRKSQFDALLYSKHPDLYRRRIGSVPKFYYVATAALLITLASTALGRWSWAAAPAAVWLAATARFTIKRLRRNSLRPTHVAEMALTSALIPPVSLYWNLLGLLRYRTSASLKTEH